MAPRGGGASPPRVTTTELLTRGVPARDVQYEVFGPDLCQADAATEPSPDAVPTA